MYECNGIDMDDLGIETNKLLVLVAAKKLDYRLNEIDRMKKYMSDEGVRARKLAANKTFRKAVKDLL